jgi:hypothetical protein
VQLTCWRCGTPVVPVLVVRRLREETEAALRDARDSGVEDDIDWESARCAATRLVLDEDGNAHFQVVIEGVSPDAGWLQEFVRSRLKDRGLDVEVITRW